MMNFLFCRGRVSIRGVSSELQENLEEFAIFVFDAYYINVCVKFDIFFLTTREKAYPCANCQKKFTVWNASNKCFQINFGDVIKIEIIFKYSGARAIPTYSSRAKSYIEPP